MAEQGFKRPALPVGIATGVGSLPGSDLVESAELVLAKLPGLAHLPELPGRGPWFDMVGRGCALLLDLPVELGERQWRFSGIGARGGRDLRRAKAGLAADIETFAERVVKRTENTDGDAPPLADVVKVQVCGPVTLAATVELSGGHTSLSEPSARRDIADSLTEGVAQHVLEIRQLLPAFGLVVQIDEPAIDSALDGLVPTPSGFSTYPRLEQQEVRGSLAALSQRLHEAHAASIIHSCGVGVPIDLLGSCGADGLSLDLTQLDLKSAEATQLGGWLDKGGVLFSGVELSVGEGSLDVNEPSIQEPSVQQPSIQEPRGDPDGGLIRGLMGTDWLGECAVTQLSITPRCGLAGSSKEAAMKTYERAAVVAEQLHVNWGRS